MKSSHRRRSKRLNKLRFERLEPRHLLSGSGSGLPFDDSGLAPAGMQAICALPNLPVFNVVNYGAKGDGVSDDTLAIRAALSAAEAAQGGIIYLPAGTYAVDPQSSDPSGIFKPIFTITSSNIVFIGDGAGRTHLAGYCQGLKDPVTNWTVTGDSYIKISRFDMFSVDSSAAGMDLSTIQFRSLDINGQAGYTGNSLVGGNITTGDGWDMTHKAFFIDGNHRIDSILVFNCDVQNWRGEEIYAGGSTNLGAIDIVNCHIHGTNASAVSCSGTVLLANSTIGGNNPGDDVYNGLEDLAWPGQSNTIQDSTIECSSDPANPHGNGFAYIGASGSSLLIERTTFTQCHVGIQFSEDAHNVLIENSTFSNNTNAMITTIQNLYPGLGPPGFSDITISNNTFSSTGVAFIDQSDIIPNLVLNGNTVTNGRLLAGTFPGSASDWAGFLVENTTLGTGAKDINDTGSYHGVAALWTGTIRPVVGSVAFFRSAGDKVDDFSGQATITVHFQSDLTVLNANTTTGPLAVTIDPATLAEYPIGFTTTIYAESKTNWLLKADPSWNTFPVDLPVGPNGLAVKLTVNSQGLFDAQFITVPQAPPEVQGIYATGAAWSPSFLAYLQSAGLGTAQLGYALLGGTNQLTPLPWSNLTTISVVFSQDVTINAASAGLALTGSPDLPPAPTLPSASFSYSSATHTAQWTFAAPLTVDKYLLSIPAAAVTNSLGMTLDGDWTNATNTSSGSQFPSGDGVAGGDFNFRFNVLPGDVDQSSAVTAADFSGIRDLLLQNTASTSYSPYADLNGDGNITGLDGGIVRGNLLTWLPATDPGLIGRSSGSGGVASFASSSLPGTGTGSATAPLLVATTAAPSTAVPPTSNTVSAGAAVVAMGGPSTLISSMPPGSSNQVTRPVADLGSAGSTRIRRLPVAPVPVSIFAVPPPPDLVLEGLSANETSGFAAAQVSIAERVISREFLNSEVLDVMRSAVPPTGQFAAATSPADGGEPSPVGQLVRTITVASPIPVPTSDFDTRWQDWIIAEFDRDERVA